jgi:hypothetical protein
MAMYRLRLLGLSDSAPSLCPSGREASSISHGIVKAAGREPWAMKVL